MITVRQHLDPSVADAEEKALHALVIALGKAQSEKLLLKYHRDGYTGWDDPQYRDLFVGALQAHAERGDWLDVANLAAFLWNMDQP